jgi:hypothetical protein
MIELLAAVLGAGAGLLILRSVDKWNVSRHQDKLEMTARDFDKIQARLEGEQSQEDKETKRKVDEITKEQNDKPSGNSLAEWFNRRKR